MTLNNEVFISEKIRNLLDSMITDENIKKTAFPVYSGTPSSRVRASFKKAHKKCAKPDNADEPKYQHAKKYDPLDNVGLCVSLPKVSEMDDNMDMGELMTYLDKTFFHGHLMNSADDGQIRMLFDNYVILPGICVKFGIKLQDIIKKVMSEFPEYMTVDFLRDIVKPWYRHEISERKLRISGKMTDAVVYSEIQRNLIRLFPVPEKPPRGRRLHRVNYREPEEFAASWFNAPPSARQLPTLSTAVPAATFLVK